MAISIGKKLTAWRVARGWTQRQLAEALAVTETTIRNYEHDRHSLDATHQIALGKLAGPPDCWFWWGLAGLTKEEVQQALGTPSPSSVREQAEKQVNLERELTHGKHTTRTRRKAAG